MRIRPQKQIRSRGSCPRFNSADLVHRELHVDKAEAWRGERAREDRQGGGRGGRGRGGGGRGGVSFRPLRPDGGLHEREEPLARLAWPMADDARIRERVVDGGAEGGVVVKEGGIDRPVEWDANRGVCSIMCPPLAESGKWKGGSGDCRAQWARRHPQWARRQPGRV